MIGDIPNPLIIAHRGSSVSAPENTIAAFEKAIGVSEGIEFDVRISRDGDPVVFHDASLRRVAGDNTRVDHLTTKELADVDVGKWFNETNPDNASRKFFGEGIPSLEDAMRYLKDFVGPIYVELKTTIRTLNRLAESTGEILREFNAKRNLIVKSFDLESLPVVRGVYPEIESAALFEPNVMRIIRKEKWLLKIAEDVGASSLSLHHTLATKRLMRKTIKRRMPVAVWTTDHPRWIKKSQKLGIKAIITNDPAKQRALREHAASSSLIT